MPIFVLNAALFFILAKHKNISFMLCGQKSTLKPIQVMAYATKKPPQQNRGGLKTSINSC